jgi:dimethylaniline monooxygenase (N-oxide forming)
MPGWKDARQAVLDVNAEVKRLKEEAAKKKKDSKRNQ